MSNYVYYRRKVKGVFMLFCTAHTQFFTVQILTTIHKLLWTVFSSRLHPKINSYHVSRWAAAALHSIYLHVKETEIHGTVLSLSYLYYFHSWRRRLITNRSALSTATSAHRKTRHLSWSLIRFLAFHNFFVCYASFTLFSNFSLSFFRTF